MEGREGGRKEKEEDLRGKRRNARCKKKRRKEKVRNAVWESKNSVSFKVSSVCPENREWRREAPFTGTTFSN